MATLANFPMKNQLTAPAGPLDADGINDNPRFNCVDESLAAAIQYLTGKTVYGEELKDAEYGDKYQGGTALRVYVDNATDRARAKYGVTAEAFNSTDTTKLISQARAWIRAGYPVIVTIPSAWGTAHTQAQLAKPSFSTHVVCLYSEFGGNSKMASSLTAMNPWGGVSQAEFDTWWKDRLCYGQVWRIYKEEAVATTTTKGVPTGWKDDGKTLVAPNGVPVKMGFRDWVLAHAWDANNWPLAAESVISSGSIEPGNASIGPGSRQDFRLTSLGWTSSRNVYVIYVGQDIRALQTQLHDALVLVEDLKQHAANPAAVVLSAQQKEDLANMAALRATLASMLDGKAS